jgi:molybdopterin-guanine dinucleotide biosynthesis protein A
MQYTIYILADGKSSRMGEDKGLIKINGIEMIAHCVEFLRPLQQEIVIVSSNNKYKKFSDKIIGDTVKNQGPAQGIVTALEDSKTTNNLIVSCDMPLFDHSFMSSFVEQSAGSTICCFEDDYLFPFPGWYSKTILSKWTSELEKGNHKMQTLIKQFDYKTLPIKQHELFLNVNTTEDLQEAEKILKC